MRLRLVNFHHEQGNLARIFFTVFIPNAATIATRNHDTRAKLPNPPAGCTACAREIHSDCVVIFCIGQSNLKMGAARTSRSGVTPRPGPSGGQYGHRFLKGNRGQSEAQRKTIDHRYSRAHHGALKLRNAMKLRSRCQSPTCIQHKFLPRDGPLNRAHAALPTGPEFRQLQCDSVQNPKFSGSHQGC